MPLTRKLAAEFIGTFWLVLGGCGSAVLSAGFPVVGIGLLGVSFAFGLTVLTGAFAFGHISGAHFNPAVSFGLFVAGRFPAKDLIPYWLAQVVGGVAGATVKRKSPETTCVSLPTARQFTVYAPALRSSSTASVNFFATAAGTAATFLLPPCASVSTRAVSRTSPPNSSTISLTGADTVAFAAGMDAVSGVCAPATDANANKNAVNRHLIHAFCARMGCCARRAEQALVRLMRRGSQRDHDRPRSKGIADAISAQHDGDPVARDHAAVQHAAQHSLGIAERVRRVWLVTQRGVHDQSIAAMHALHGRPQRATETQQFELHDRRQRHHRAER